MFTEEFKKACEGCKSEEELKAVIDAHKSELTDEEIQQVSGGADFYAISDPKNPFDLKRKGSNLFGNSVARTMKTSEVATWVD